MDSFEALGLAPEIVEALAAHGSEVPTPVQAEAIPIIRRGSSLLLRAGPGGGAELAWAVPVLQRLLEDPPEGADDPVGPSVLVVSPDASAVRELARSLGRLAAGLELRVAALAPGWVDPAQADIVVATPADAYEAVRSAELKLSALVAVVVTDAAVQETLGEMEQVTTLLQLVDAAVQRIVTALPVTPGVSEFVRKVVRKAVEVPTPAPGADSQASPRGTLRYLVVEISREEQLLSLLGAGARRQEGPVLVFTGGDDETADLADFLTLHGHLVGTPGDDDAELWITADAQVGRAGAEPIQPARTISFSVPVGPDELDRRHAGRIDGIVMVRARELPHLREAAGQAQYRLEPFPEPVPTRAGTELERLRDELAQAASAEDLLPWVAVIEPLLESHSGTALAAGALRLLQSRGLGSAVEAGGAVGPAQAQETPAHASARGARAFVRLFISVGSRDRVGPGDLVGAIAGEAGIDGSLVGKVEIRDSFSLVEVEESAAERIIRALNGTTIRGRSVRVDLDRGSRRGASGRG